MVAGEVPAEFRPRPPQPDADADPMPGSGGHARPRQLSRQGRHDGAAAGGKDPDVALYDQYQDAAR